MIVSWNWLSQYVRLDMSVERLTERLASTGLNHESTDDVGGDLAIDLEVTSNRSDCLGHIGVAREVSVLFDTPLRVPDPRPATSGAPVESLTSVSVEAPDLCGRFTARVVSGVKVGESPWWMRKRLETLGVRPVSNVVDVTNYVMLECGQPLHAYDLDHLAGRRLVVRRAVAGEKITTINNKVYDLTAGMLAIADAEKPVGLAGVMGGLECEIGPGTHEVLIEAARFDAMSVRKTARALGLFSPSSYRFERPLDPEVTEWASRRCAELILETAGGVLHPGVIDVSPPTPPRDPVTLRLDQIARVLGISVPDDDVERILRALGLTSVSRAAGVLTVRPPSWRSDLEREIDLIEEVARVHGYEHIPEDRAVPLTSAPRSPRERVEDLGRDALTACGFDEAVTFSLVSEGLAVPASDGPALPAVRVEHASRKRDGSLRQSLIPSLLAARQHNEAHGTADACLFEIADVYIPQTGQTLPEQPARLAMVAGLDFFGMKGVVAALAERLHLSADLEYAPANVSLFADGRTAEVTVAGRRLGFLGEIDRATRDSIGLRAATSAAELDLAVLIEHAVTVPAYRPLSPSPLVARDLSLVVDRSLPWAELAGAARSVAGETLESVEFLDHFQGDGIPEGRHSVHFGLKFRHPGRTLTGEEVERSIKAVLNACVEKFSATQR